MTPEEIERQIAIVLSGNDQEIEAGREWFRNSSPETITELVIRLLMKQVDPLEEIVSRLALIQFTNFFIDRLKHHDPDHSPHQDPS